MSDALGRVNLEPCPFCGGQACVGLWGMGKYFVNCVDCSASTNILLHDTAPTDKGEAVEAWNRRAAPRLSDACFEVKPEYRVHAYGPTKEQPQFLSWVPLSEALATRSVEDVRREVVEKALAYIRKGWHGTTCNELYAQVEALADTPDPSREGALKDPHDGHMGNNVPDTMNSYRETFVCNECGDEECDGIECHVPPSPSSKKAMRCAECDCENGGEECTWIKSGPNLMQQEPVAWLVDLDGTGSLHAASRDDPNAIPVYATPQPDELRQAKAEAFNEAIDRAIEKLGSGWLTDLPKVVRAIPNPHAAPDEGDE